jgi:Uma2 family endonuclease
MNVSLVPNVRMDVDEFLAWSERQADDHRYELVNGEVITVSPERYRHSVVKFEAAKALDAAVKAAGVPCRVLPDGPGVMINDSTMRIPDASVRCRGGAKQNPDSTVLAAPLIVLEVVSPSTERDDLGDKLVEYLSVPSIHHYLIVLPKKRAVAHHRRNDQGEWSIYIGRDGDIVLDPPGIKVAVADLIGPDDSEADW